MGFEHLWPLLFLAFVPGIVLLYLLKQKVQTKKVPALNLWQEAFESVQASTPWEKFRNHLLMYLQIAVLLLLIFAMLMPYIKRKGGETDHVVLCIDTSGSMNGRYQQDSTKLEEAKKQALTYVDQLDPGTKVTVVTGAQTAQLLVTDSTDTGSIKKTIRGIGETDIAGSLEASLQIVTPLVKQWHNYKVIGFTDSDADVGKLNADIIALTDQEGTTNVGLSWLSHQTDAEHKITTQAGITNYGEKDFETDVELYLGDTLFDAQTVSLKAGQSKTITFQTTTNSHFRKLTASKGYLKAHIVAEDGNSHDNTVYEMIERQKKKTVLLVSKQNSFMERALSLEDSITVEQTTRTKNINPDKAYDFIVYDGVMPTKWYHNENVILLAPSDKVVIGKQTLVRKVQTFKNGSITFPQSNITQDLEAFTVSAAKGFRYALPSWAYSFAGEGNQCVGYLGKLQDRVVAVLGFDLHNSDLPLQMEFPVLVQGILAQAEQTMSFDAASYEPGDTVTLQLGSGKQASIRWQDPAGQTVADQNAQGQAVYTDTRMAGLYHMTVTDTKRSTKYFAVTFPEKESKCTNRVHITQNGRKQTVTTENVSKLYGKRMLVRPLILIVLLLLCVEWIVYRRRTNSTNRFNKVSTIACRILLFAGLTAAFIGISMSHISDSTTTVFVVDVSQSFAGKRSEMVQQIRDELKKLPSKDRAGVVAFGGDANVEQFVSDTVKFTELNSVRVETETNIEKGLQTAMSLFSDSDGKRIVLLTDGRQNSGDVRKMSSSLQAGNVELQVLQQDCTPDKEVWLSDMTVPEQITPGERFTVEIEVTGNVATNAVLQLYNDTKLRRQEHVTIQKGTNHFTFQDQRKQTGFTNYRAVIVPEKDTIQANNEYVAYTKATEQKKVLLIEGKSGESKQFQKVLQAAGINYDVVTPSFAPDTLKKMREYSSILLENVYADDLKSGFMDHITTYVKDYAGGLIAIGGDQSFALGAYRDTALEKVLPVNMEIKGDKDSPKLAMTLVIDHSGSMTDASDGGKSKLEYAKEAAAAAVNNLRSTDIVGIESFDDGYHWQVKPIRLTDRDDVLSKIYGIKDGGGTSIYPALKEAYEQMTKVSTNDAQIKHIVLLTDGQDTYHGYDDLLKDMNDHKITLSTVAVGSDADVNILRTLADKGKGRFYQTNAGTGLSRIFAQEVFLSQGEYLVNKTFTPVITANSDILEQLREGGFPEMLGYVGTTLKSNATAVLMDDKKESPILATWQYGLGTTAAFTTDVVNEWTANYAQWEDYPAFWRGLINQTIGEQNHQGITVTARQEGSAGVIEYTNAKVSGDDQVTAVYDDADGKTNTVTLHSVSGSRYEGEIPLSDVGVYQINVRRSNGKKILDNTNTQLTMQYSAEYRYDTTDTALNELIASVSGRSINSLEGCFDTIPQRNAAKRDLTLYLLMAMTILWFVDIWNRRMPDMLPTALRRLGNLRSKAVDTILSAVDTPQEESAVKTKQKKITRPKKQKKPKQQKQQASQAMLDISSLKKGLQDMYDDTQK